MKCLPGLLEQSSWRIEKGICADTREFKKSVGNGCNEEGRKMLSRGHVGEGLVALDQFCPVLHSNPSMPRHRRYWAEASMREMVRSVVYSVFIYYKDG